MPTLLLRLAGPMQAWGTTSRFDERDTQLEPSKSGVIGLVCAALGRDRAEEIDDLARLRMGVRVDREGVLMRDFQTATGIVSAEGAVKPGRTVVSPRYFLADGVFLAGLEGGDANWLLAIHSALQSPTWPLFLGRRSFPPSQTVWLEDGVRPGGLRDSLLACPRLAEPRSEDRQGWLRLVLESESEGSMRLDQPVAPFAARRFGPRRVASEVVNVPL